jgi:excisionase family DNA binding protein
MQPNDTTDQYAYSVADAGIKAGVGRTTMWGLVREGAIPTIRIGRRVLITRKALLGYLDSLEGAKEARVS